MEAEQEKNREQNNEKNNEDNTEENTKENAEENLNQDHTSDGEEEEEDEEHEDDTDDDDVIPKKVHSFLRNENSEPSHTVLSSPFAKLLMLAVAGPIKPIWYKSPSYNQFYDFKNLISLLEEGRERSILFKDLLERIQKMAPTITAKELWNVIVGIEQPEAAPDVGDFFFVLCNNPMYDVILQAVNYQNYLLKHVFSPRQRLFYSSLAHYCLIQTEDDIERFYRMNTVRHKDILTFHIGTTRTIGLRKADMELKQRTMQRANEFIKESERTPYTSPLPFVKATIHEDYYKNFVERSKNLPISLRPLKTKVQFNRKIKPLKVKRQLGDPVTHETEEARLIHQYQKGQLPRPDMRVPAKQLKEMRTIIREDQIEYLYLLRAKAMKEYYERLKRACVLFSKRALKDHLKKGFRDDITKAQFFSVFKSLMPLSEEEFFILHPWTPVVSERYRPKRKFERPPFGRTEK